MFEKSELLYPILACAAFSGIFTPLAYRKNTYIDGGVLNNFPVDLLDECDFAKGSYVNKVEYLGTKKL